MCYHTFAIMKKTSPPKATVQITLAILGISLIFQSAHAEGFVTFAENPKDFNSSLSGTSVYDFNSLKMGLNKGVMWNGVGTFDQVYVMKADQYGGAADAANPKGSPYSVQGAGTPVKTTILTLNAPSSYFGMYWSAGDASNQMSFYNGKDLVAQFDTGNLMSALPKDYYGNPINRAQNAREPYGFINFFGDSKTQWDRVVFTNVTTSGFESDNYTSRVAAYSGETDGKLPGVPVVLVTGTAVTKMTSPAQAAEVVAKWSSAAPAAPAPPLVLLLAFAGAAFLRARKTAAV